MAVRVCVESGPALSFGSVARIPETLRWLCEHLLLDCCLLGEVVVIFAISDAGISFEWKGCEMFKLCGSFCRGWIATIFGIANRESLIQTVGTALSKSHLQEFHYE